ncbi:MMPL family transporter [Lacticaseibacillus zhaodongensis]|uniref:MMPL family transporter n=1 Tax=Lacticaseibacillus zhaodongensis TaxID=2668065 RepID=UPI0012D2C1D7|nr:MMPL family transporter [Lacticaseibacillus zhaodongensis]
MQNFNKHHGWGLIAWVVVLVLSFVLMPNVSQLVRDYGQTKIPSNAQSQVADVIQKDWGRGQGNTRQAVIVFSNGDKKLTSSQKHAIDDTVSRFKHHEDRYHVKDVMAPNDNAATKAQLISKDKTTELMQLQVSKSEQVKTMTKQLTAGAKTHGVKTYVTSGEILNEDFVESTEKGIQKTELIAAIFIFIVLILVFRSPVVPVVSLLTVGVAVVTSMSVIMNLVKHAGFPLSSFTEVFLVVVLFGIGTDYNILLYDQFKEELSSGLGAIEATNKARKIAGRTILYSGLSVLIGFSVLGLAKFSIYQSAVGVAVGVAVLLLVLLTLNPFFMSVLGKRIFWPTKNFNGGSRSRMWNFLAKNSVAQPFIALGIIILLAIPSFMTYSNHLNYDSTVELGDHVPAKVGFRVVQDHFSKGTAEPATVYIQSNHKLNNEENLKVIDQVTKKLQSEKGVKTVASVTEPAGSAVKPLYVNKQLGTVTTGMGTAGAGLAKINKGLNQATDKLASTDMASGLNGVQTMIAGTNELLTGSSALTTGTQKLAQGSSVLTSGVGTLNNGLQTLSSKSGQVNAGVNQLSSQSAQLPLAIAGLSAYNTQINAGVQQINSALAANSGTLNSLAAQQQKLSSLTQQAAVMKQQVAQAKQMLPQMQQMLGLLQNLEASESQISALQTQAQSLTKLEGTLKTALTQVGANTQRSAASEQQIIVSASKIAQDPNASQADRTAANEIITTATANLKNNIQPNGTILTGVQSQLSTMKTPDTSALNKMVAQLPSQAEVKKLTTELAGMEKMINSADQLLNSTSDLSGAMKQLSGMSGQMNQLTNGLAQLQTASASAAGIANQLNAKVNGSGVNTTNASTIASTIGNSTLNGQLQQLSSGLTAYTSGVQQAASGSGQLVSGSQQLTAGLTTVAAQTPQLTTGLQQEADGQKTMYSTLQGTVDQMKTLQSGLTTAGNGVGKINKGVASASSYLSGLQDSAAAQSYYVPKQILKTKDYKTAVKTYMSADHKTTKLTVVLSTDPASATSMKRVDNMQGDVQNALKGTPLKNAKVAIGGQTASTSDTQHIASSDFVRTAAIMIIGILLALMVVTRSILQPLYIIATLVLAYVASLSLTRLVSGLVLGQHMLTWNTPFFSFVMLIALGVDYSIFLMMKYREFGVQNPDPKKRIVAASGVIGAVVLSAAVILSGTFAALMPSGVLTLIQVALAVIIGLIILVFIIPVILPGLISLTYGERGENGKHSKEAKKSEK